MSIALPPYFFRIRENGATVFRVTTENRLGRIEMEPIASLNLRSGEVKPQGGRTLTEVDRTAIDDWIVARRDTLARREADEIEATIDRLNLAAHWAQSRATDAELDALTDRLLMAMHDLRSVLVRRKADRLPK
ncbi:hypothetical protein ACRDNQ_01035 [Palleronia sp. KMU-117]|uniref:hypothetical protein n=1 Tax=Palleronia sp. KMU-117 TaxID=3434108 RepID=UPI003D74C964